MNLALPGNPRYQPKDLVPIFGYDNLYRLVAEVEIAVLKTLGLINVIPESDIALLTPEIEARLLAITTTQVDEMEKVTKHDIRAWVKLAQEILPASLRRWLHVPLTSYDALETARALQFSRAFQHVVRPKIILLMSALGRKVEQYATTVQIGRTHGQHALPITVGFWLATILNRILVNAKQMDHSAAGLVGKISGAVGAYNAQVGLGISAKCGGRMTFEELVLSRLDLTSGPISTQILPPEPMAYFLFSATIMSAVLGQLGRDCRHLMRTEIGELSEPFGKDQVGSSTMAHKRNPISFENLEGMWLRTKNEFGKVLDTLISEHQRDLVGSSVVRDLPIILVNLVVQLNTLLRGESEGSSFIDRITVNQDACNRNLEMQSGLILAEPLYIALQMAGYPGDAHELINKRGVGLVTSGKATDLLGAVKLLSVDDPALQDALLQIPEDVMRTLEDPKTYIGLAVGKAREIRLEVFKF